MVGTKSKRRREKFLKQYYCYLWRARVTKVLQVVDRKTRYEHNHLKPALFMYEVLMTPHYRRKSWKVLFFFLVFLLLFHSERSYNEMRSNLLDDVNGSFLVLIRVFNVWWNINLNFSRWSLSVVNFLMYRLHPGKFSGNDNYSSEI